MTKTGNIIRIVLFAILFVGIVGYLAYFMFHLSTADPDSKCTGVDLVITNENVTPYITQDDVDQILNKARITPTGKLMRDVNTKVIESFVKANPYVKEVSCFKSSTNKVVVEVDQRTPIIYVIPDGKEEFFLDEDGEKVPNERYMDNVVVASGNISEKYAKHELYSFAQFLRNNEFWNDQIEQIYVSVDRRRRRVVELVPRVGDNIIFLGPIDDFEKKLKRLKVFYDKAVPTVGWGKYTKINLEYDNQIICTKHKK